jgi:hypothetical protein
LLAFGGCFVPFMVYAQQSVATTVALTITTPLTIAYGQDVDGYAEVTSSDGSALSGTITFYDGTRNICVIPAAQSSSCPPSAGQNFVVGKHVLTAVYSGDSNHVGSTSNAVTVTVLSPVQPLTPTVTTLTSSANPSAAGQSVTFTATVVTGVSQIPTGSITFLDSGTVLGTSTVNASGVATFVTSQLTSGSHSLTAIYAGNDTAGASISGPLTQVVNQGFAGGTAFTITTDAVTVATGKMSAVTVKVIAVPGFNEPVELGCSNLPAESACTFGTKAIPAGGGSTTLQVSTMSPHACGEENPYWSAARSHSRALLATLLVFLVPRRRKMLRRVFIAFVAVGVIGGMTGCGSCTDLGTRPGTYTILVTGRSTGGAMLTVSQKVTLKVTP